MSRDSGHRLGETVDRNQTSPEPVPRVAVVAGADTYLGRYTTERLRADGWLVGVTGERASSPTADPTFAVEPHDEQAMHQAVRAIVAQLGPPSLLVIINDAPTPSRFSALDSAAWARMLDHVVGASLGACRTVIPILRDLGGGTVLAISPAPIVGAAHYAAAHYTLLGMMRSLAIETAPDHVNVTTVVPVLADPDTDSYIAAADAFTAIGDTIIYLSGEGSFCTGQVMAPDTKWNGL